MVRKRKRESHQKLFEKGKMALEMSGLSEY